jgi:hypothetical protein
MSDTTHAWGPKHIQSPLPITVAFAEKNYDRDFGHAPAFSVGFPSEFLPLVDAAMSSWENVANIDFIRVRDAVTVSDIVPDIRIGVSAFASNPTTMEFIGYTSYRVSVDTYITPGAMVTIEDPVEHPVQALPNGDYQYAGLETTVFQTLLHELGHAIGLDHNFDDPSSIMYPVLGSSNPTLTASDVEEIRSIYGFPLSFD